MLVYVFISLFFICVSCTFKLLILHISRIDSIHFYMHLLSNIIGSILDEKYETELATFPVYLIESSGALDEL